MFLVLFDLNGIYTVTFLPNTEGLLCC